MTLANFDSSSSGQVSHSHNLSINSVSSIVEPTTPPAASGSSASSKLWDSNKLNANLALPTFNLDATVLPDLNLVLSHYLADSLSLDKENFSVVTVVLPVKIDKEYLALISKVPLSRLTNDIFRLAKDQHGCRFLQKRVDENVVLNPEMRMANFDIIFGQVHPMFYDLIIDPFGNYLIQKLLDYCHEDNLNLILETLQFNLFLISINQHGTRALQKIIDRMNNPYQLLLLVKGLKPYIIELIKDLNGNHVIQKILNKYSPENCQFIYDSIISDLLVVATHKHGCCVLQKCLNHVNPSQLSAFSNEILTFDIFTHLVNDQFGNYVLQYLISIDSIDVNYRLYNNFVKFGIDDLCNLKFSSNVIEKLMKNCYNNEHRLVDFSNLKFTIIMLILKADVSKLINDPYGNYVIQTLIDIMINPNIVYFVELPGNERMLLPSLQMLLLDNIPLATESLQVQIIKIWFQNCKIVSSFGKRIQLKINIVLNGVTKVSHRKPLNNNQANMPYHTMGTNQSMNASGEFVKLDPSMPIMNRNQTRSMSMDTAIPFARQYNKGSFRMVHSNPQSCGIQQQHNFYDGYALNPNTVNMHNAKAAPRIPPHQFDATRSFSYSGEAGLADLHISNPKHPNHVPYAKVNQTMTNFSSNEFMTGVGNYSQDFPIQIRGDGFRQLPDRYSRNNDNLRHAPMGHVPHNTRHSGFPGHQRYLSDTTPFNISGNLGQFQG